MQDPDLNIIERCYDGKDWWTGLKVANPTVLRCGLAAISHGHGEYLRLYYGAEGSTIREKCWDPESMTMSRGWFDGVLFQDALPGTRIAALGLHQTDHWRVYFQRGRADTTFSEFCCPAEDWKVLTESIPAKKD